MSSDQEQEDNRCFGRDFIFIFASVLSGMLVCTGIVIITCFLMYNQHVKPQLQYIAAKNAGCQGILRPQAQVTQIETTAYQAPTRQFGVPPPTPKRVSLPVNQPAQNTTILHNVELRPLEPGQKYVKPTPKVASEPAAWESVQLSKEQQYSTQSQDVQGGLLF